MANPKKTYEMVQTLLKGQDPKIFSYSKQIELNDGVNAVMSVISQTKEIK